MNIFLDADLACKQILLESLGIATCLVEVHDDELVIVAMDDLYREFYCLSPDTRELSIDAQSLSQASGLSIHTVEPLVAQLAANIKRSIATRELVQTEFKIPQITGPVKWARNTISPVLKDDKVACLLISMVDITEVMNVQKEIEEHLTHLIGQHIRVCRGCKRIQDESANWVLLETLVAKKNDINLSHGICPDCKAKLLHASGT